MDAIADLLVCIADTVVHMNGKNSGSAKGPFVLNPLIVSSDWQDEFK